MQTPRRITGVTVKTVLDGRTVDVVFRSPYRWRIYEGGKDVTRDFGFNGRALEQDDPRRAAFHDQVDAGEIRTKLHVAA